LEIANEFTSINLEGAADGPLTCNPVMTFLMPTRIKVGKASQWHRKNKKVECIQKLLIVGSRNVKQDNSPRLWRLILSTTCKSANRKFGCRPKEATNGLCSVKRPIITGRRNRNYFGRCTGKFLEEFFDANVERIWKPGKEEQVDRRGRP
jgi:hypothetical protein